MSLVIKTNLSFKSVNLKNEAVSCHNSNKRRTLFTRCQMGGFPSARERSWWTNKSDFKIQWSKGNENVA